MKEFNLLQKNKSGLYFLYVGNVYPHKNLERVIKAIVFLNRHSETKVNLYIVCGRNIFEKKLEKIIYGLKAEDYINFLGYVSDEGLGDLYKNSVGFIFPSLSEGFGLSGLEAMKAGTILLASDIPVFHEIYGKHVIYFDPIDQGSIAKAIEKTLKLTQEEGDRMVKENKEFVKRYSWEKMAKETLEVYNSVK